jgi:hypothetical protein
LYLRLHHLPEHIAHKGNKLQIEIVAVLCLLALFTHEHLFWVAALLLAFIDIPDFGRPLRRMAKSLERIAGITPDERAAEEPDEYPPSQKSEPFGKLNRNKSVVRRDQVQRTSAIYDRGYEISAGVTRLEEARPSQPKPKITPVSTGAHKNGPDGDNE